MISEINNTITVSNNITLRKVNVKPYEFDKMSLGKDLIEHLINQLNEREFLSVKFYSIFLNQIHPFSDGNGRNCKILFPTK